MAWIATIQDASQQELVAPRSKDLHGDNQHVTEALRPKAGKRHIVVAGVREIENVISSLATQNLREPSLACGQLADAVDLNETG